MRALGIFAPIVMLIERCGASCPEDRQIPDPKSIASDTNPAAHPVPIDDLYYTRNVAGGAWSPDGKQVVFTTDMSGRLNLWKVNATGSWPIQLTPSADRPFNTARSLEGKWIVYQQDKGGNELWDLYAVPAEGGEIVNLTNTPEIREESPLWSPDGATLALNYKPKESTVYDIALLDWATRKVRKLTNETTKTYSWSAVAWSANGKTLFANRSETSGVPESDVYSIDVATGKRENLTPHQGKILYAASSASPDSKTLLITSTQKNGFQNVALLDVASKKLTWVTDTKWEASSADFSRDGESFTYTLNEDGESDSYLVNRASTRAEKVALPPALNSVASTPTTSSPGGIP